VKVRVLKVDGSTFVQYIIYRQYTTTSM